MRNFVTAASIESNSLISFLAPKPFNVLSSEIKIRSSLVSTGMFTKSVDCYPVNSKLFPSHNDFVNK